jgi:acetyl esterase
VSASAAHIDPLHHTALVEPASAHPPLDAIVQSFLDRWEEDAPGTRLPASAPDHHDEGAPSGTLLRPAHFSARLPLFLYLEAESDRIEDRTPALQAIADGAGVAVLRHSIAAEGDLHAAAILLQDRVKRIAAMDTALDAGRIAIGGDGLGATIALYFVSTRAFPEWSFRLLVLATPVLDAPSDAAGTAWMSAERAARLAARAAEIIDAHRLAADLRFPPILILTAEADPFRDAGEALARRLMTRGLEVAAIRVIGTIHDFTWLPALRDAPGSVDAARSITDALRHRLSSGTGMEAQEGGAA